MTDVRTLLLIDGNPVHADIFQEALQAAPDGPFEGEWVNTHSEGIETVAKKEFWAIFLNLRLPGGNGLDTLSQVMLRAPRVPILVMGATGDEALAMKALRVGAKDYLLEDRIDAY